jgi:hypothetical protein
MKIGKFTLKLVCRRACPGYVAHPGGADSRLLAVAHTAAQQRHVRQRRGRFEKSLLRDQTDHGAVVSLVVAAAFVGRGASEISRELRWPVRYDHSHCD